MVDRTLELVRRALGAERVEVRDSDEGGLARRLPSGRWVVAVFAGPPPDDAAGRLDTLVASFEGALDGALSSTEQRDSGPELVAELAAVAESTGAREVVVIDTHSPVVWGSAHGILSEEVLAPRLRLVTDEPQPPEPEISGATRRAIARVRAEPGIHELTRGGHLRLAEAGEGWGLLARSFAEIYVLILIFDGAYDELGAERVLARSLGHIEKLVLGLPPPDPHTSGRAAARRR